MGTPFQICILVRAPFVEWLLVAWASGWVRQSDPKLLPNWGVHDTLVMLEKGFHNFLKHSPLVPSTCWNPNTSQRFNWRESNLKTGRTNARVYHIIRMNLGKLYMNKSRLWCLDLLGSSKKHLSHNHCADVGDHVQVKYPSRGQSETTWCCQAIGSSFHELMGRGFFNRPPTAPISRQRLQSQSVLQEKIRRTIKYMHK